jgi:hypothetical protein
MVAEPNGRDFDFDPLFLKWPFVWLCHHPRSHIMTNQKINQPGFYFLLIIADFAAIY